MSIQSVIDAKRDAFAAELGSSPHKQAYLSKFNGLVERVFSKHDLNPRNLFNNPKIDALKVKLFTIDLDAGLSTLQEQHMHLAYERTYQAISRELRRDRMNHVVGYDFVDESLRGDAPSIGPAEETSLFEKSVLVRSVREGLAFTSQPFPNRFEEERRLLAQLPPREGFHGHEALARAGQKLDEINAAFDEQGRKALEAFLESGRDCPAILL